MLLTASRKLHPTEEVDGKGQQGRSRRRNVSVAFLPPLKGGDEKAKAATELPREVQRRLAYVAPELEIAQDGTSAARRFLVAGRAPCESTRARDPASLNDGNDGGREDGLEALRWEALATMMKIVTAEDTAEGVVSELNPLVPTREGWSRANAAYFGEQWTRTSGYLEQLSRKRRACRKSSMRMRNAYSERLRIGRRAVTTTRRPGSRFCARRGSSTILGLSPPSLARLSASTPGSLPSALVQRAGLPPDQARAWRALMAGERDLPNPQTDYTVSEVYRFPGQLDYEALALTVGQLYAMQVIRTLDAVPGLASMAVYRPSPQHRKAENRRLWPSPVASFLQRSAWMPLASGKLANPRDSLANRPSRFDAAAQTADHRLRCRGGAVAVRRCKQAAPPT